MQTDFNFNVRVIVGVTPALETLLGSLSLKAPQVPVIKMLHKPAEAKPQPGKPEPKTEAEQPDRTFAKADVRAAIDQTRRRIIGEEYQNDATSENYKKYYRALTKKFKEIAAFLGADRPSKLPVDKIGAFVSQCDEIQILDDGTLGTAAPF